MKKHIYYYRDKLKLCYKDYLKVRNLQILKKNFKLKNSIRQKIIIKNFRISKNNSMYKLKKYCYFTGRLRFIIKNNKMSRMTFRENASKGLIVGIYKI